MSFIEMESPGKKVAAHPKVSIMVDTAIKTLAESKGSSLHAINKYISANYSVNVQKLSTYIKKYLKAAVESGDLIQPKGKGASGSFKINKQKIGEKPTDPTMKSSKSLKMQTSTPKKALKSKKADMKSPNKSPVKKLAYKMVSADATFSKPKTKSVKKSKVSLPTKPRRSLVSLPTKVKKPKKLVSRKVNESKSEGSPSQKPDNSITSPKLVKNKGMAKSTKPKKSPKPGKSALALKKAGTKKGPVKEVQK